MRLRRQATRGSRSSPSLHQATPDDAAGINTMCGTISGLLSRGRGGHPGCPGLWPIRTRLKALRQSQGTWMGPSPNTPAGRDPKAVQGGHHPILATQMEALRRPADCSGRAQALHRASLRWDPDIEILVASRPASQRGMARRGLLPGRTVFLPGLPHV